MSKKNKFGSEIEKAIKFIRFILENSSFRKDYFLDEFEVTDRTMRRYIQTANKIFPNLIKYSRKENIYKIEHSQIKAGKKFFYYIVTSFLKKLNFPEKSKLILPYDPRIKYVKALSVQNLILDSSLHDKISKIFNAIIKAYKIKFKYSNKIHTVDPYGVVEENRIWYFIGVEKEDIKTFLISQIEDIEIIYDEPSDFNDKILEQFNEIDTIWQISFNKYEKEIIAEIKNDVAHYFKNNKIFHNQEIIKEYKTKIKVKFVIYSDTDFKVQVLPWIPFIRILKPEEYKEYLAGLLKEGLEFQMKLIV